MILCVGLCKKSQAAALVSGTYERKIASTVTKELPTRCMQCAPYCFKLWDIF